MTRLRKIKERQLRRQAAVQNIPSPFSNEDCLKILDENGYGYILDKTKPGYVLDESKYEYLGTSGQMIGYAGFYSKQALTKKEKETISFPIIFYNEIYSFIEKETGKYETFLISWAHDINGQILSKNEVVTPDRLVRRDPIVKKYNMSGGELKRTIANNGDTIGSYAIIGTYNSFEETINKI